MACEAKFGEGARRPGEHNKNMSGGTGPGQCARMLSHLGMTPVRRHHNCVSCTHGTHREDLKAGGTTRGKKGRGTDPRKLSLVIVYPCSGTGRRKVGKARTPGTGGASGVALPSQKGPGGPGERGGGGALHSPFRGDPECGAASASCWEQRSRPLAAFPPRVPPTL